MSHRENITRIKAVYLALEELATEVVFVGGATVSLYSTRPETETRPTDDVDIVVEIMHYKDYVAIEERLRSKGFVNDVASGVICRYIIQKQVNYNSRQQVQFIKPLHPFMDGKLKYGFSKSQNSSNHGVDDFER